MTAGALRVLHVEDTESDAKLVARHLQRAGYAPLAIERVETTEAYRAALHGPWDVVLADHTLPAFSSTRALAILREMGLELPFLIVSGSIGEEAASAALRAGAHDFVAKDNLARLGPAIERARRLVAATIAARAAEATLRASEAMLAQAQRIAGIGSWEIDLATRRFTWSESLHTLFGTDPARDEVTIEMATSLIHPDDRARAAMPRPEALVLGASFENEMRYVRRDGVVRTMRGHSAVVADAGGRLRLVGMLQDVTDRLEAEKEHATLAAIVESTDDAIIGAARDGKIVAWNGAAERLFGLSALEARGRDVGIIVPADLRDELARLNDRMLRGERIAQFETERVRRNGERFAASLTMSAVRDPEGGISGSSTIVRDITDRQRLTQRLLVADRMVSVGTLAAGVAHEINNPLAYVLANLEFVARELPAVLAGTAAANARGELETALGEAKQGAERVRLIVRDLRTFSRADDEAIVPVQLAAVLDSAISLAWNEIRHRARLERAYGPTPAVNANESRLAQVFLNLLINAAQAIPEGAAERNVVRVATYTGANGAAVIEVSDTGEGIAPDKVRQVFDPFYTTKPIGVGTGLGLAICQGIVSGFGGEIAVESKPGAGATFRVTLPAARALLAPLPAASPLPRSATPRRGRVLVVDDDALVLASIRRTLAREHDVRTATDGAAALEQLRAGERFDAIVTDLMMPHMTGMELFEMIQRDAPDMAPRVIFLTGGAFTAGAREFLDRVTNPRLEKPFDISVLRGLIQALLR